jgi:hypothetical protein
LRTSTATENARLLADLGLSTTESAVAQRLQRLQPFQALWKVRAHTALVDHQIADDEWPLANTDAAMRGGSGLRG